MNEKLVTADFVDAGVGVVHLDGKKHIGLEFKVKSDDPFRSNEGMTDRSVHSVVHIGTLVESLPDPALWPLIEAITKRLTRVSEDTGAVRITRFHSIEYKSIKAGFDANNQPCWYLVFMQSYDGEMPSEHERIITCGKTDKFTVDYPSFKDVLVTASAYGSRQINDTEQKAIESIHAKCRPKS
jgi:hypothetical protein